MLTPGAPMRQIRRLDVVGTGAAAIQQQMFKGQRAVNPNALSWIFHRWPTNVVAPVACTFANGSANVTASHAGLGIFGFKAKFATSGTLPAELTPGLSYFCNTVDGTHFTVSSTLGGTAIVMSGTGSGSHTVDLTAVDPQSALRTGIFNLWDSGLNWGNLQPVSQGSFDYSLWDPKILPVAAAGMQIVFRFGFTPAWAQQARWAAVAIPSYGNLGATSPPANNSYVTDAMAALVTRYNAGRQVIFGFEVCNEPDMLARNQLTFSGSGGTDPLGGTSVENPANGATANVIGVSGSVITVDGMTGNGWANGDTIRKPDLSWSRTVVSQLATSTWSGTYAETAALTRAMRLWLDANASSVKLLSPGFAPADVAIVPSSTRVLQYMATADGGGGTPAAHCDVVAVHDYMNTAAEVRKAYQSAAFNVPLIPNMRAGAKTHITEHGAGGGFGSNSTDVRTARLCHDLACAIVYDIAMCVYGYDDTAYWNLFADQAMQSRLGAFWSACKGKTLIEAYLLLNDNIELRFSDGTRVRSGDA